MRQLNRISIIVNTLSDGGFDDVTTLTLSWVIQWLVQNIAASDRASFAALYPVRTVGEIDLGTVVDPAFHFHLFLLLQNIKQHIPAKLSSGLFLRRSSIFRNIPCFSGKEHTLYFTSGTIIPHCPFGKIMFLWIFSYRNVVHWRVVLWYRQE